MERARKRFEHESGPFAAGFPLVLPCYVLADPEEVGLETAYEEG